MPFFPPFNMPFFYNDYRYTKKNFHQNNQKQNHTPKKDNYSKKNILNKKASDNTESSESSEAFFEIFGLKLYFDDILIMCILFFLYTEKVHDDELFICLILLLLT